MTTTGHDVHIGAAIADQYLIESHLLSSRSADAYRVLDKARGMPLCLWMLRHPLARQSKAVERFADRIRLIGSLQPPLADVLRFGIDASGMAFCVLPSLDGHPILFGNIELQEAERRFISCVRLIERLHNAGIACGDVCGHSFWVDRSGDVRFVGLMGSFDSEAAATAMMPPVDTLAFLAPEQRSGGGIEPASDVFALGVLGYFLLTGRYPYGQGPALLALGFNPDKIDPIARHVGVPPVWAESVLRRCLSPDPAARFPNAGAVARAIVEAAQRVHAEESAPARLRKEGPLVGGPKPDVRVPMPQATAQAPLPAQTAAARPPPRLSPVRILMFGLVVVVVSLVTAQWYAQQRRAREGALQQELAVHREVVTNPQLREAIDVIAENDAAFAEQAAQLDKVVNSDDPIAHDILVTSAKDAKTQQMRALSEKAIIDRARRLGLMRSSEQVRQWLRSLKADELPAMYEAVLRSLDVALPIEARKSFLRQVYASNSRLALKLTAGLALDTGKFDEYQPLLAQLAGDDLKIEDAAAYSALGLILGHEDLSLLFGDDIIQRREQLSDKDIVWLLKVLAERNDLNVRAVANLAIERNTLAPLQASFLTLVRDRTDLSPDILSALIRGAAGAVRPDDVRVFGRWYDVDSERVLLAICAGGASSDVLQETFDTLAGKSLTIEPSASLVEWVRRSHWEERLQFARAVGVLAFIDLADDAALTAIFDGLDRYAKDPDLVDILLESRNPRIARIVVSRYSGKLGLGGLINLLGNPDKDVRIAAVKALKDYNDIGALKFIIDRYERESDAEVKQAYRDNFWVIKQREGGGAPRAAP